MNYNELVNWMLERGDPQGGYTLENEKMLLLEFDNPQDKIKTIHVAGTNGKGSVCSYLQNTLTNSNLKCGLFISPFIENIRETIQINGDFISEEDFEKYLRKFYEKVQILDEKGYYVTTFEIFASIAFLYFFENNVDIAIIEVGLGGRDDSTNVIKKPLACVITSISKDHVAILGNSISEIAQIKGGIIKEDTDVFVYPSDLEATNELLDISLIKKSRYNTFFPQEVNIIKSTDSGNEFSFRNLNVQTSLLGVHQIYNACLAILVLDFLKKYFPIKDEIIKKSIFEAKNVGRLEIISKNPTVLIDGSHNEDSINALVESLKNFSYKNLILGFSVLADKDFSHILSSLMPLASKIVLTEIDNSRAMKLSSLESEVKKYTDVEIFTIKDKTAAFQKTLILADNDDLVLWCGSLYLIKEIRKIALHETGK